MFTSLADSVPSSFPELGGTEPQQIRDAMDVLLKCPRCKREMAAPSFMIDTVCIYCQKQTLKVICFYITRPQNCEAQMGHALTALFLCPDSSPNTDEYKIARSYNR